MAKHLLQKLIEEAGHETRSYSGRGMYGKTCLGVVVEGGLGDLFAGVVDELGKEEDPDFEAVSPAFQTMKTDNMGHDTIVYFTGVPHVDELWDSSSEEDEDAA